MWEPVASTQNSHTQHFDSRKDGFIRLKIDWNFIRVENFDCLNKALSPLCELMLAIHIATKLEKR